MMKFFQLTIALLGLQLAFAQTPSVSIDMSDSNWIIPEGAVFEKYDNRATLLMKKGRATVKDLAFSSGSIEVDVYANSIRSFAGITFRKVANNMEEVYMRMHKSNQVDAVQYTPIFNNESNWQLYREYQARVSFKRTGWNTLRIDVNKQSAAVFVNGEKVMTIDNLRTDQSSGEIGLFTLFSNRFSNFSVTHKDEIEEIQAMEDLAVDPTIIKKWDITNAQPYTQAFKYTENFSEEVYRTVETEKSGLLPISKFIKKSKSGNFEQNKEEYIVAATTIYSDKDDVKLFSFDYSDKIIVYLNGVILFEGNNAFRTQGVQYMGHIGNYANKLYLPLKKGVNNLHCVVIEKANGWGLMAKMEQ